MPRGGLSRSYLSNTTSMLSDGLSINYLITDTSLSHNNYASCWSLKKLSFADANQPHQVRLIVVSQEIISILRDTSLKYNKCNDL